MNADEIKKAGEIVRALRTECSDCSERNCCNHGNNPVKYCPVIDAANLIENLTAQLAASQRREKAAVEDIMCRDHCDVCVSGKEHEGECKIADYDCLTCKSETCVCNKCRDEDHWIWRGPQEAGEGEAK